MRRAALLAVLTVTACSEAKQPDAAGPNPAATLQEDSTIRCALAGAADFTPACTREIARGPDGEVWVLRHPDGSFRRFVLIDGGRRIATADGADEVDAERAGADLQVRVKRDRYLFPAAPEPAKGPADDPSR